ncbi:MAG: VacB/RNase II family 3'-5' exoribonuclease [Planctomycetota bacterium]
MSDRHTSRILDHIADRRYEPRTLRQLMAELGIPKDQRDDFRRAAEKLLKEDQIVLGSENTVGLPPVGDTMIGRYRSHERGFGFIIPDALTEHGDLFVPPGNMADAMDGDRVKAKVIRSRGGRGAGKSPYTGRIIEVLQRADRQFVGTLIKRGKTFLVQPDGRKLGDPIVVRDAQSTNARLGDKVVVDIIDYPDANKNELAEGVITEVLGESGVPDVETQSVIRAYGLGGKFSKEVMSQARDAALKMEGTEDAIPDDREDLREELILTIDPPDAKDFDDAISIAKVDKGEAAWELGVHIADVAHFVEPGSALDEEAYARGNSTYLPRKVIPMLPEVLSNGVCSLQEGVDRYAKSVFITYDKGGNVLTQRFAKTVIRSSKRLTYLEAQALIDDDIREAKKHSRSTQSPIKYPRPVIQTLKLMDELAKVIRKRRFKEGMISLGLPDVELVFNDSGHVVDAVEEDDAFTHTIIEMCMVEANEAAARVFHAIGVPMIRRTHPDPDSHGLKDLRMFARVAGYNIPANPSRQEMQWLLEKVRDTPAQHAVHMAVLKTLSKAEYSPALIGHFALASDHYSHFTSPIRRYPDFVVHRALNAVIEAAAGDKVLTKPIKPRSSTPALKKLGKKAAKDSRIPSEDDLKVIGRHCSDTERNSESAERELRKYLVLQLLETMLGDDFAATVTGVTGQGAFLQIDRYLVDGFVKLDALPGDKADRWKLNPNTGALVAQRSGRTISIGDRFTVRIADIDLPRRQMELVVLDDRNPKRGGKAHQPDKKGKKRRGDAKSHEFARAKGKHKRGKVCKRKKPSAMQKKRPRKRR